MNWIDEGALYSQIGLFLREDLGRGDITTQSIIVRNTRARARFVAGEGKTGCRGGFSPTL